MDVIDEILAHIEEKSGVRLFKHQRRVVRLLLEDPYANYLIKAPTGSGKTLMTAPPSLYQRGAPCVKRNPLNQLGLPAIRDFVNHFIVLLLWLRAKSSHLLAPSDSE